MKIKKILKGSLISLAILGMIGGSINPSTVSAHRRYRIHNQLRRHHLRQNKRIKRSRKSRKYRKHNPFYRHNHTRRAKAKRSRVHHRRRTYHTRRRQRTWKLYRKNGTFAGSFHSYKNYKYAKSWLNWYNHFEATSHKHRKVTRRRRTRKHIHINHHRHYTDDPSNTNQDLNVNQNLAEFKQQTLTDINNDRQSRGIAPLTETPELDQLANTRAQQVKSNFNHVGGDYAENLDETEFGQTNITDGTSVTNNNGYDMANNEENDLVNHDIPNWGHRRNILSPSFTQVGIGTSYDPTDTEGFPYKLVEDFE